MAGPWYVDSVSGNDGDGLSLANASTTLTIALALSVVAGDTIYIAEDHVDPTTGSKTWVFPGTLAAPNILISIDTDASEAYLRAPAAQFTATADITLDGCFRSWGLWFKAGDDIELEDTLQCVYMEDGTLESTGSSGAIVFGHASGKNKIVFVDIEVIMAGSGSQMAPNSVCDFEWRNGPQNRSKATHTTTFPTYYFKDPVNSGRFVLEGVDLSDLNGSNIFEGNASGTVQHSLKNCILHSSFSLIDTIDSPNKRAIMVGCDDTTGNKLYRTEIADYWGTTVTDDANFITSGGASDGTNPISWKMVTNDTAVTLFEPHKSHWFGGTWLASTGSKTFTVETNSENVTFLDSELWLEIEFLDASADTQTSGSSDRLVDINGSGTAQTDSAANPTWTTPDITTEKKQQLVVTKTVDRVGSFRARVCLSKTSATVWIDPKVAVS